MSLGPFFKSVGREAAEQLPGKEMKMTSLVPALKSQGVTDDELEWSGMQHLREKFSDARVSTADAAEVFAKGEADFGVTRLDEGSLYKSIIPTQHESNSTYQVKIITFGGDGRYASHHFPEKPTNYLTHSRSQIDHVAGKQTNLIFEVQSDLHQRGRERGYSISKADAPKFKELMSRIDATMQQAARSFEPMNEAALLRPYKKELKAFHLDELEYDELAFIGNGGTVHQPKSPFRNTWLKKSLELELGDAVSQNLDSITVPITGHDGQARSLGVHKWYETSVVDTMRKIAAQQGAKFELFPTKIGTPGAIVPDDVMAGLKKFASAHGFRFSPNSGVSIPEPTYDEATNMFRDVLKPASASDIRSLKQVIESYLAGRDYTRTPDTTLIDRALDSLVSGQPMAAGPMLNTQTYARITMPRVTDEDFAGAEELKALVNSRQEAQAIGNNISKVVSRYLDAVYGRGTQLSDLPEAEYVSLAETLKGLYGEIGMAARETRAATEDILQRMLATRSTNPDIYLDGTARMAALKEQFGGEDNWLGNVQKVLSAPIKEPKFTLYAAPPATVLAAYYAQQQGQPTNEYSEEVMAYLPKVHQAKQAGYTDQEIAEHLAAEPTSVQAVEKKPEASPISPADYSNIVTGRRGEKLQALATLKDMENEMTMSEVFAAMKVVYPNMRSVSLRTAGVFGHDAAAKLAEEASIASAQRIVNHVNKQFGLNVSYVMDQSGYGAYYVGDQEVDIGFIDSLLSEGGEMVGGTLGAIAGAIKGRQYGGNWGMLAGSLGGAMVGAAAGSEIDYIRHALNLQVDMSADVAAHKALTAAEVALIGDVIGAGVFKGGKYGWAAIKRAKDFVVDGNSQGAYQALKEVLHITDDDARDYVTKLEKLLNGPAPGNNDYQKRIAATLLQKPGAEFVVYGAADLSPSAATQVTAGVANRAASVTDTVVGKASTVTGERAIQDLGNYVADVKQFFSDVKQSIEAAPRAANFSFNYDKIAIEPVLEKIRTSITDPAQLARFMLQQERIRGMTTARGIGDLLELRNIVNNFRRRNNNHSTSEALEQVVGRIDTAIDVGASHIMGPDAGLWKANWEAAKSQYAKMKAVEKNVLFRAVTKPGISEDTLANQLVKYSQAIDSTFEDVMAKLPANSRPGVEHKVIEKLATKYSVGVDGMRAINFTELDKELSTIPFLDKDSRQMQAAVHELAEVFRNDVGLLSINRAVDIPKFQQMLTDNLFAKLKYGLASEMYNGIRSRLPGERGRNAALLRTAAQFLAEPLNMKSMKEIMDLSADSVDISPHVVQIQQEAAARAAAARDQAATRVKLYGPEAVKKFKGIEPHSSVPMHRIATQDEARAIAKEDGIIYSNTRDLDYALKSRGYMGIVQGTDRVRTF